MDSNDSNGNLTASGDGWTVTYNLLNLPAGATKGTGGDALVSSWTYLADGTKIGAYHSWREEFDPSIGPGFPEEPAPGPDPDPGSGEVPSGPNALDDPMMAIMEANYVYAGPFRLKREMFPADVTLESAASVCGRFVKNGNSIQQRYFIADHLGSTRVVLNNAGSVVERYDYYPYGEKIPVMVANTGNTDYLYTGKESQNALFGINWYDSGARFQTTDGIFTSIDPIYNRQYNYSPYSYCIGNPIRYTDSSGMMEFDKNGFIISALGGLTYDFYHLDNGDVRIVNTRNGQENIIEGGSDLIKDYSLRTWSTNWWDLFTEFIQQEGPINSMFAYFGEGKMNSVFKSLLSSSSNYGLLLRIAYLEGASRGKKKGMVGSAYFFHNPFSAGFDMWEQMMGRVNLSWYELGDCVLFMINDSKSNKSLFYRFPGVNNHERLNGTNGFGDTKQTYIWIESKSEIKTKDYLQSIIRDIQMSK